VFKVLMHRSCNGGTGSDRVLNETAGLITDSCRVTDAERRHMVTDTQLTECTAVAESGEGTVC